MKAVVRIALVLSLMLLFIVPIPSDAKVRAGKQGINGGNVGGSENGLLPSPSPGETKLNLVFDIYGNPIIEPEQFADSRSSLVDETTRIGLGIRKLAGTWRIEVSDEALLEAIDEPQAYHSAGSCNACDSLREKRSNGELKAVYSLSLTSDEEAIAITDVVRGENGVISETRINEIPLTINIPLQESDAGDDVKVYVCNEGQLSEPQMRINNRTLQFNIDALSPFGISCSPKPMIVIGPEDADNGKDEDEDEDEDDENLLRGIIWSLAIVSAIVIVVFCVHSRHIKSSG